MHTLVNETKLPLRRAFDALGLSPATAYRTRQPKRVRCSVCLFLPNRSPIPVDAGQ